MINNQSCASRYSQLESQRHIFLTRSRDCSELTLPYLIPPEGHSASTIFPTPYQSVGARAVNVLASKLLLALLPPSGPFFRLMVDDLEIPQLKQEGRGAVEEALGAIERAVMSEIEVTRVRVPTFEMLKHLIVSGNALVYFPEEGGMRVFPLERYVCQRDAMGNVLEIIVKESVSPLMLPEEIRNQVQQEDTNDDSDKSIDLYTKIIREADQWVVRQEVKEIEVPNSSGTYKLDNFPWMVLRFDRIDGESYGRGLVEQYLGDLRSLEGLSQALVEGTASSAKVLFLVRPNGTTKARSLANSPNGAIIQGDANDVSVLQVNKAVDFRIAESMIKTISDRLAGAFLMSGSVQRDAERVTATEVRLLANEIESGLGGIFSLLSQEFQLPLVRLMLKKLNDEDKVPPLPEGVVRPQIITGLEAMSRSEDLKKLMQMMQMFQPLGAEGFLQQINIDDFIDRVGVSLGIDPQGLLKSKEEQAQLQQQAQQQRQQQMVMEIAKTMGPEIGKQLLPQIMQMAGLQTQQQPQQQG